MAINYDKFEVFLKEEKIADIEIKREGRNVYPIVNQYIEGFMRVFKKPDNEVTMKDLTNWLEWRTLPPTRFALEEHLDHIGVPMYDRWSIIQNTHAKMAQDDIWIRYDGEELTYKDVFPEKI